MCVIKVFIVCVIKVFIVCVKKQWILSASKSSLDCGAVQADRSLHWAHMIL